VKLRAPVAAILILVTSLAASIPTAAAPAGSVPQNPAAAPNGRSHFLNDSYASQTYAWAGPAARPTNVLLGSFPDICHAAAFDHVGRVLAWCKDGPSLRLIDPVTLQSLARIVLPAKSSPYFHITVAESVAIPANREIWIVDEVPQGDGVTLVRTRNFRLTAFLGRNERIVGVSLDWTGRIWFVTVTGAVGLVHPSLGTVKLVRLPTGETVVNSISTDETGGVFVVSTAALYRIDLDSVTGRPKVTWREPYDAGTRKKPGQLSKGSGTTPTLMGTSHVAITDNADPRMHVLVYRRQAQAVGTRLVCAVPVFGDNVGATENSLVATATSAIVSNNYGYTGPTSVAGGGSTAPGITRVDLDPTGQSCSSVWTNPERTPSVLPKMSLVDGRIYTYTKDPDEVHGTDVWNLVAIDFETGQTIYEVTAGTGQTYDNSWSAIIIGQNGAVYFGVVGGMIRLQV
jgi:hypothetical protein